LSLNNVRPITVSNALSNILEVIILRRVNEQLPEHRLQFGFRAAMSTNHAVALLNTIIAWAKKLKKTLCLVALDAGKAFDSLRR
jgi:hypothetical protein